MKRDVLLYLKDILDSIEKIESFTKGKNEYDLKKDDLLQSAVIRKFEIIGEAVKGLPKSVKEKHSTIKWRDIAGTRDILIHFYFGVQMDLLMRTIKEDLPLLKKEIKTMIKETKKK